MRLVQRGQWSQGLNGGHDGLVDADRGGEAVTTMDDTVADGPQGGAAPVLRQPAEQGRQHRLVPGAVNLRRVERGAVRALGRDGGLVRDGLHLTPEQGALLLEQRELEAARPGVEREDGHQAPQRQFCTSGMSWPWVRT